MNKEQKEILKSIFSSKNIFTALKSAVIAAVVIIGLFIILFWGLSLTSQFSEKRNYINSNIGSNLNLEKKYLCSVNGKKLCTKQELIGENIYMAKLSVFYYFYLSYYPQPKFENHAAMALNLLVVIKIFTKLKKDQKILL